MTLIRHFTKPHLIQPILSDGIINKKRTNSYSKQEKLVSDYYGEEVVPMSRETKEAYAKANSLMSNHIGDYV